MDDWILTLCNINPRLEQLALRAEKKALAIAKRSGNNTEREINRVLELVNRKNAFFNLRVIYNSMTDVLSERESAVLSLIASDVPASVVADRLGLQRTSIYKILARAIGKCSIEIGNLGYDRRELEREFLHIPDVEAVMRKFVKRKSDCRSFVPLGTRRGGGLFEYE